MVKNFAKLMDHYFFYPELTFWTTKVGHLRRRSLTSEYAWLNKNRDKSDRDVSPLLAVFNQILSNGKLIILQ